MNNDVYQGWLALYRQAHAIKSPVKYNADRTKRLGMAEGVFERFLDDVHAVLGRSKMHLERKGFFMPQPLWKYKHDDPTTHVSSPHFAYDHLIKDSK